MISSAPETRVRLPGKRLLRTGSFAATYSPGHTSRRSLLPTPAGGPQPRGGAAVVRLHAARPGAPARCNGHDGKVAWKFIIVLWIVAGSELNYL